MFENEKFCFYFHEKDILREKKIFEKVKIFTGDPYCFVDLMDFLIEIFDVF